MILPCSCNNEGQDRLHGKGWRVHNFARMAFNGQGGWRCTVCGKIKPLLKKKEK